MSFESLLIHMITVFLYVEGSEDRYGNAQETYDAGTAHPARVQYLSVGGQGRELLVGRDTTQTWYEIFTQPGVVVDSRSVITWEGKRLQVDGEPTMVHDGIGEHHLQIMAKETVG